MEQVEQQQGTLAERRTGKRHSAVLLLGKICGDKPGVCLVHNISATGLMARFVDIPTVGQSICIEVRGLSPISGTVRWVNGRKAGVQFDSPQPYERIFSHENEDGTIPRAPRFAVTLAADVRVGTHKFTTAMIDVSAGGAKMVAEGKIQPGLAGHIVVRPLGTAISGTVAWVKDGRFGFRFVSPLSMDALAAIVALR